MQSHLHLADPSKPLVIEAFGLWETEEAEKITLEIIEAVKHVPQGEKLSLDLAQIISMDTLGVISLLRLKNAIEEKGSKAVITNLNPRYTKLFQEIEIGYAQKIEPKKPLPFADKAMLRLKTINNDVTKDVLEVMDLLGGAVIAIKRTMTGVSRFHIHSLIRQIDHIAFRAVPIVMLITFLIGAIIAQQGIFHFRTFGAEIFVVDMVGVLTLRELGVLIVSIMIAGRTGSAYTAELGSMKMREEIDALRVMGLEPMELLILPRILAMIIGLPLLTIIGDFSALAGGALTASLYGDITFNTFFERFQEVVNVRHLWIGLSKAPFMALVIGLIACMEGMRVKGSAESLGLQTTSSVVKAIFMVIVLDGLFAMFFAALGV